MTKKTTQKGLPPLKIGLLATTEEALTLIRARDEEELRRMCELADVMGIPDGPSRWYSLAAALARKHVSELQESKPMGAPKKWGDYELGVLYVEMRRVKESCQPRLTDAEAAGRLSLVEPWKSYLQKKGGSYFGPDPIAALLKAYASAKKNKWSAVTWDAFQYHESNNTIAEWDAAVRTIRAPT